METKVGEVKHFFEKIGVAVIELSNDLKVGDRIHIKGATTDFNQDVESMQVNHQEIKEAKGGDLVGIKVKEKVRPNDKVFLQN